jgi:tyrosinase
MAAGAATIFVRRDVYALPAGDPTIPAYAEAVATMQARDPQDPTSWTYQAALHATGAAPAPPLANGCRHGSWWFIAWHRMYLYYFERIVRAAVVANGGPADWALPYWNYGIAADAGLPPAFRTAGPLFVPERRNGINAGAPLNPLITSPAKALADPAFIGAAHFGGAPEDPAVRFSGGTGLLEQTPHNVVHVAIGGWMGNPATAALDPIFWLHHGNIDRVWWEWSATNANPTGQPAWMQQPFPFFDESGAQVSLSGGDVIDTVQQLQYTYDQVLATPPGPSPATPRPASRGEEEPVPTELVGASAAPVRLVGEAATVSVAVDTRALSEVQSGVRALDAATPNVELTVEDIEGDTDPGTIYGVYVNLPEGASIEEAEQHHAGNVSFFGLERAQQPAGDEHGHNLAVTMDITSLLEGISDGPWTGDDLVVSFRPLQAVLAPDEPGPLEMAPEPQPPVTVGRVSVHVAT